MKIGILIITKNEELNLEACLESCRGFDEIMIIDSFSTVLCENLKFKCIL
jgi:glycosyltransferase involved in cell wall biosynthesis